MQVRKRSGSKEPVSFDKILNAVKRNANGLSRVEPEAIAMRAISGMFDGISTRELDELCARACADAVLREPEYAVLGGRILIEITAEDVLGAGIKTLADSIDRGIDQDLVAQSVKHANWSEFCGIVDQAPEPEIEVFGAYTIVDRYLLKDRKTRLPIESPKQWLARVALGVADNADDALRFWQLLMDLRCLSSTPTLFNAGTTRPQMSSCFLMDSPDDSLEGIYKTIADVARMSKFAGGIATSWTGVRSLGSLIKGTNGLSNGIVPWLRIEDASVAAVNQGGKRLGAAAVYLETWHADIEDFLELRNQEGDMNRRCFNLNMANWIPDLFMKRVEANGDWTLFDPADAPELKDMYGDAFEAHYIALETAGKGKKTIKAQTLFDKMMRTLSETGRGWMCWKDRANALCNQAGVHGGVVHSSNLCTEIIEVTRTDKHVAVCNLLSMNAVQYVQGKRTTTALRQPSHWKKIEMTVTQPPGFDAEAFGRDVEFCVKMLDSVIDKNHYTITETKDSNLIWRPVGLGLMGLTDAFHELEMVYGDDESRKLNAQMFELMAFHALNASCRLAEEKGPCPAWTSTQMAHDNLFHHERWHALHKGVSETWQAKPTFIAKAEWDSLRARIKQFGLRNSLLVAVAPTATIALIAGVSECTEVMQQLAIRRETMGGDFIQVNKYAVRAMQDLGLWTEENITRFKHDNGSVQNIPGVPEDIKQRFRTAFEVKQKTVIDMAVDRAPWIDQSQSLNLFIAAPTVDTLSSMYMYAWRQGLKTTYYLRRRPETEIAKTTGFVAAEEPAPKACAIDDPNCEACQ